MPAHKHPPKAPAEKPKSRRKLGSGLAARYRRLPRSLRALTLALAAMLGTILVVGAAFVIGWGKWRGPKRSGAAVEIEWPAGLGPDEAAALLAQKGLVDDAATMAVFLRATGGTEGFVAGPHLLFEGASPWDLRRMLERSFFRPSVRVTIPEGWNRFDIAARMEKLHVTSKKRFIEATVDKSLLGELGVERPKDAASAGSAEGYLFPSTYDLPKDSDPREVVKRMVAESDRRWSAVVAARKDGFASVQSTLGWGRKEVLTLASLIEKEAVMDDERPIIASVFYNRLLFPDFKPRRLQSDPTSVYGCLAFPDEAPSCAGFTGHKPTPAIHRDPQNRYSTYTHEGLPPGPIANPGAKSIDAALAPATTRYLYFVAKGGGRHTFSESLDAHNNAVQKGAPR